MHNLPLSPMYDPTVVEPMRNEVTSLGVTELRSAEEVDQALKKEGTTLLFVNSVCGCAAGMARPALRHAMKHEVLPDNVVSVFAGQDREATQQAREYILGVPPSSPMFALFRDGEVVHLIPRHHIEGQSADQIAANLQQAFDTYCSTEV